MNQSRSPFISCAWLKKHLNDENLSIIDASWYLPSMERDADAEYLNTHIPNAIRFDIDKIAEQCTDLVHMVANESQFAKQVGELGVSQDDIIIIYDAMGLFSAARVWWNFKIMGAANVFVLNGGLPKWIEEGHAIETGEVKPIAKKFLAREMPNQVVLADDIISLLKDDNFNIQIVDVRPKDRFLGLADEPREGLRRGHIPNSKNLPFLDLINEGRMVDEERLRFLFTEANIDLKRPIISSCGSGVTAPILNLALASLGIDGLMIFDGSWAQWGAEEKYPIQTQMARN
jgi:thiosulfate/3-mercaptopyruvate sulfurtransferase